MHIPQVMGGVYLHVRTCRYAPFPHLGNGWTDCAEIWCVVSDPLAMRFTVLRGGVHLHVRTCVPFFRFSGPAGRIALKFGMLLGTNQLDRLHKPGWGTLARAHVQMYPLFSISETA